MIERCVRKIIQAIIVGFIASLFMIILINQNFFGFSETLEKAIESISFTNLSIIYIFALLLATIFHQAVLQTLRSFFIGPTLLGSVESYTRFVVVIVFFLVNPYDMSVYPHYMLVIANIMTIVVLVAVIGQLQLYILNKKNEPEGNSTYIDDIPVVPNDYTSASQNKCIEELSEVLLSGHPRSVSLTGPWGSGKTMVYEKARNNVEKKANKIIWVKFEPWRYASEEALVKGFYESIAKEIESQVQTYQNLVGLMAKTVNQFVNKSDRTGVFSPIFGMINDSVIANYQPDEIIKQSLNREKLRLIIVVDDIERQYKQELIYRTLQLVHHAKSISKVNIQILCIYEKEALMRCVPSHVPAPLVFLEKFSEMDITVLPPVSSEIRKQINRYLEEYQSELKVDGILALSAYEDNMSLLGSYRSVIRIFNDLIKTTRMSQGHSYTYDQYVCFEDRFAMAHLKLSYPLIYQDIYKNRGRYYTMSQDPFGDIKMYMMNDEQKKTVFRDHFDTVMQRSDLSGEEKDSVLRIICNLFPIAASGLGVSSIRLHVGDQDLKRDRQVADSDVLDAYFETTSQLEEYNSSEKLVKATIAKIDNGDNLNDHSLLEIMSRFIADAKAENIESTSFFLMQQNIRSNNNSLEKYKLPVLRSWLRAVMRIQGSTDNENRRVLGRILTVFNEIIRSEASYDSQKRKVLCKQLFENVIPYIEDARAAILLLLYLIPERGNGYFPDYIPGEINKHRGLFERILSRVNRLIIDNNKNIYKEYDYGDWAFVSYQWACSIRASGRGVNTNVIGSENRYVIVTDYLLSLLNADDSLAYTVISRRLEDKSDRQSFDGDTFAPFTIEMMIRLTDRLKRSNYLTGNQRKEMKDINKQLQSLPSLSE